MSSDIQPTLARLSANLIELVEVEGHTCGGYEDYFGDYECTYSPKITCEECVFVVGRESLETIEEGKDLGESQNSV